MLRILKTKFIPKFELNLNVIRLNSNSNKEIVKETKQDNTALSKQPHNDVPKTMVQIGPFYKFLIHRYSNEKYASVKDVPDKVTITQLHYAKDKGRAASVVILIGLTILGSLIAVFIGKQHRKQGIRHTDDLIKQHAEYSKIHQDMIRNMKK